MRGILLVSLALIALASAKSVFSDQEEKDVKIGYHDAVGIPEAARLKAEEETIFADGLDSEIAADETNDRIVGGAIAPSSAHPHLVSRYCIFCSGLIYNNTVIYVFP